MPFLHTPAGRSLVMGNRAFWLTTARYNAGGQLPAVIGDFRRGLFAVPQLGPEIIVNGGFTNGLANWSAQSATTSVVGNEAQVTTTATNGRIEQAIATTPGKLYRAAASLRSISGASWGLQVINNAPFNYAALGSSYFNSASVVPAEVYFLAKDTTSIVQFACGTSGAVGGVTNISVKEVLLGDVGVELINPANWQMSVSGTSTATNSPQGTLNLTGDGTQFANGDYQFTGLTVGQAYTLIYNQSVADTIFVNVGTAQGGIQVFQRGVTASGAQVFSFVATATTIWVRFARSIATLGVINAVSLRSWTPRPTLRSATFNDVFAYTAAGTASRSYVDASGVLRNDLAADQPRYTYENGKRQLALNNAITNKCVLANANPTSIAGWTKGGDASAVFSVVDDSAALAAAGLSNVCSNGKVYKLDNSVGTGGAWALDTGQTTNTNKHSVSVYARKAAGAPKLTMSNGTTGSTSIASGAYARYKFENVTPGGNFATLSIVADPGDVVYFILQQMEEAAFASPVVIVSGSAVTRPIETARFSPLVEAIFQRGPQTTAARGILTNTAASSTIVGQATNVVEIGLGSATSLASFNGTNSVNATIGSGDFTTGFGTACGADASGRSVAANGGAVGSDANGIGDRSQLYLGRRGTVSAVTQYGDGFYDEVVLYAGRLTSTQLQTQAMPYA